MLEKAGIAKIADNLDFLLAKSRLKLADRQYASSLAKKLKGELEGDNGKDNSFYTIRAIILEKGIFSLGEYKQMAAELGKIEEGIKSLFSQ